MGYIVNHAIVVESRHKETIQRAHEKAAQLFPRVSPLILGGSNGSASFFVPPDGSKEGWPESDAGDAARDELVAFLRKQCEYASWAELTLGGDDREAKITRHGDESANEVAGLRAQRNNEQKKD